MRDDLIKDFIEKNIKLIEINPESLKNALERAGKFLVAEAVLTSLLKEVEMSLAKTTSIERGMFSQCILESTGKNVTQQKIDAESNPAYIKAREEHEELEAKRRWIKSYVDIFRNAHVMYRQHSNLKE